MILPLALNPRVTNPSAIPEPRSEPLVPRPEPEAASPILGTAVQRPSSSTRAEKDPARDGTGNPSRHPQATPHAALSPEEQNEIQRLRSRDAEVRRHEQAHAAAGGAYAGAPEYEYERGPDGRSYAVGGEVPINAAPVEGDPAATMRKMEQVKRAALAPAQPSSQDRQVAASAQAHIANAREALREGQTEEVAAEGDPASGFAVDTYRRVSVSTRPRSMIPVETSLSCAACGKSHGNDF